MPYDIVRKKNKYCVKGPGGIVPGGCHELKRDAEAHRRALYAAENKAFVTIVKEGDARRMFLVTSNSYEDRDRETITTGALKTYVETQWEGDVWKGNNYLLFGHRGAPIGLITFCEMWGAFLVEVADELDTPYARKRWDYIEAHPQMEWGASHGFDFEENTKIDGVYHHIEKFETSVLPLARAANALTLAGVVKMNLGRLNILKRQMRLSDDDAKKLKSYFDGITEILGSNGVEHKAVKMEVDPEAIATIIAEGLAADMGEDTPDNIMDMARAIAVRLAEILAEMPEGEAMMDEATEEMQAEAPVDEEERKGLQQWREKQYEQQEKLHTLLDQLINDTVGDSESLAALADQYKALEAVPGAVKELGESVKVLSDEIKAVKRQLAQRPRASVAAATEVDKDTLPEAVKEAINDVGYEYDSVLGLRLKKDL